MALRIFGVLLIVGAALAVVHYVLVPLAGWCGEKLAEYMNKRTRFKMP